MADELNFPSDREDPVEIAASEWIARRERGLTAAEQEAFLQWLRENPSHGRVMARLDQAWQALDALQERKDAARTTRPDPDLLAAPPRRRPFFRRYAAAGFAIAAAVALMFALWPRSQRTDGASPVASAARNVRVIAAPETQTLPDGSTMVVNGGKVEVAYAADERRIRLLAGEAHFKVAKNPSRPFIVDTGSVTVRAVGTAFDVAHAGHSIDVLVTEGKVQVQRHDSPVGAASEPTAVVAGQRATVDAQAPDRPPQVSGVPESEIERALAWQGARLEFAEIPLGDVVTAFNARNELQLACGDAAVAKLLVGGNFRADNVEAFVRLLEKSFGVSAERRGDGVLVLRLGK